MTNAQPAPGAPSRASTCRRRRRAPGTGHAVRRADAITEMLEKLDEVSRQVAEGDDGSPVSAEKLAALDRQADLLERAHRVLADALAAIDHA